mgnify:CR=1 FL=1
MFNFLKKILNIVIVLVCITLFFDFYIALGFIFKDDYYSLNISRIFKVILPIFGSLIIGFFLWRRYSGARTVIVILKGLAIAAGVYFLVPVFGYLLSSDLNFVNVKGQLIYLIGRDHGFSLGILILTVINMAIMTYFLRQEMSQIFNRDLAEHKKSYSKFKEFPLASREDRLNAAVIDKCFPIAVNLLPLLALYLSRINGDTGLFFMMSGIASLTNLFVLLPLGIISLILIYFRSQTIGKWMFNLQVVDNNSGKKVGFWRYVFLRNVMGEALYGTIILAAILFRGSEISVWVFLIYFIVDSLCIFRKDRRTMHDLIANTMVIKLPEEEEDL